MPYLQINSIPAVVGYTVYNGQNRYWNKATNDYVYTSRPVTVIEFDGLWLKYDSSAQAMYENGGIPLEITVTWYNASENVTLTKYYDGYHSAKEEGAYDPYPGYAICPIRLSAHVTEETTQHNLVITAKLANYSGSVSIPISTSSYSISYNGNGATGGSTSQQTKWLDFPITLQSNGFTRPGFRFVRWNTSASGSGTSYNEGYSYTENANLSLYAIWARWIESLSINEVVVRRTNTNSDVEESDEGTYAYVRVPFTVIGAASGSYNVTVTLTSDVGGTSTGMGSSGGWTIAQPGGEELQSQSRTIVEELWFSGLSTEASYSVSVSVNASNLDNQNQQALSAAKTITLPTAYYTMDVLGDGWLYNKTTDSSVVSGKTYYMQGGEGTPESPYEYTPVSNPIPSGLANYYEADGQRPGHGISFGAPARQEGFNVAMTLQYYGQATAPVCVQTGVPSRTDMLWLDTSSTSARLKYHNGSAWTPLPSVWG